MNKKLAACLLVIVSLAISSVTFSGSFHFADDMGAIRQSLDAAAAIYTVYVPDDFPTIQEALNAATTVYKLNEALHIYTIVRDGIYAGTYNKNLDFNDTPIKLRSENGPATCIIDCEGAGRGFYFHSGETSRSVVDGFTILHGGLDSTGGIACWESSPLIKNCIISGNSSPAGGGGIVCWESSPIITNCMITENSAGVGAGGGIMCGFYSFPLVTNCTISGNSSEFGGAIACDFFSSPTVVNCILWNNSAPYGSEIALTSNLSPSSLAISYCDVEGGAAGVYMETGCTLIWGPGNIDADPLFASGPLGDHYLSQTAAGQGADSPCIDAGSDAAANLGLDLYTTRTDHHGDTVMVDMGYHYGPLLTRINLVSPVEFSILSSPPTFSWTPDGGTTNVYVVDFHIPALVPLRTTPVLSETNWTMPKPVWNQIPAGRQVYWRVRGADLDVMPLTIITGDEVWSFLKQ